MTEALKRIEPVLEECGQTEDVEIDECIVNRQELEKLCSACKKSLRGEETDIKIPLELIIMEEFWRKFAKFLKES